MLALTHTRHYHVSRFFSHKWRLKNKQNLPCGKTTPLGYQTCYANKCAKAEKRRELARVAGHLLYNLPETIRSFKC